MKIAICYSGQPRQFKEGFVNQIKTFDLAKSNVEDTIDTFCHFWYDHSLDGQYYWDKFPERGKFDKNIKDWIYEEVKPIKCEFETPRIWNFQGLVPDLKIPHPLVNVFSMLYSIEKSIELKSQYEKDNDFKYDLVIRLRSDLCFGNSIESFHKFTDDKVHILNEKSHTSYAINDQFAIGSSELMNLYSHTFTNIFDLVNRGSVVNPECLVGFNLHFNGIEIVKHNWEYCLFRDFRGAKHI